jgi:predicted nucleotide-binding protein
MQQITKELTLVERRCLKGAALLETKAVKRTMKAVANACDELEHSWSGSWLGYQSRIYYADFQPRPPGAVYSIEWGTHEDHLSNPTSGDWREYAYNDICDEILRRAGKPDQEKFGRLGARAAVVFEKCQEELLASLDAFLADGEDARLRELRETVAKAKPFYSVEELARADAPKELRTRDSVARGEGIHVPAHVRVRCWLQSISSHAYSLHELCKAARQARLYLQKVKIVRGKAATGTEGKVFIGHGKATVWRDLKELLQDRLQQTPDEFNLESAAGMSTTERLGEMLDSAAFAFLVMTSEDEHADSTLHARENVIHEAGLFQGHLGFRRAIILLEEGCSEFSNIKGLGQIRFPKGDIKAKSEEIRKVLEREGLLQTTNVTRRRPPRR